MPAAEITAFIYTGMSRITGRQMRHLMAFESQDAAGWRNVTNGEWEQRLLSERSDTFSKSQVQRLMVTLGTGFSATVLEWGERPKYHGCSMMEMQISDVLRKWTIGNGGVSQTLCNQPRKEAHGLELRLYSSRIHAWVSKDDYYFVRLETSFSTRERYYVCDGWAAFEALLVKLRDF